MPMIAHHANSIKRYGSRGEGSHPSSSPLEGEDLRPCSEAVEVGGTSPRSVDHARGDLGGKETHPLSLGCFPTHPRPSPSRREGKEYDLSPCGPAHETLDTYVGGEVVPTASGRVRGFLAPGIPSSYQRTLPRKNVGAGLKPAPTRLSLPVHPMGTLHHPGYRVPWR